MEWQWYVLPIIIIGAAMVVGLIWLIIQICRADREKERKSIDNV